MLFFVFGSSAQLRAQGEEVSPLSSRVYWDSVYVERTKDSVRVPISHLFSFHTNTIDWFTATPNLSVEIDLSRYKRSNYSLLFTGKWNPSTMNHTVNPRWVYSVSSMKGELRHYWRTGNQTGEADPLNLPEIERDTTLWGPLSKWSYYRRRVLSSRYVKKSRYWRAYYLGFYGAYNKFSLCLDGDGKQGNSYSVGLSAGWSVPLYKHLDGSGWDFDIGASVGVMMSEYDEYKYFRESACYAYTQTKPRYMHPMVQDLHISLVYRMRSIDSKVLYGATRFMLREERRLERENLRRQLMDEKAEKADSALRYTDINTMIDRSKAQLALYTDTTAYYYEVLKAAVDHVEKNSADLRTDSEWQLNREVLMRYLEYYMNLSNEMVPEELRTDRLERAKQRKKDEELQAKEATKQQKEAEKQQKEAEKQQKEADKQAAKQQKEAQKAAAGGDVPVNTDVPADENAEVPADENAEVSAGENAEVSAGENAEVPADENADDSADENAEVPESPDSSESSETPETQEGGGE